MKVHELVAELHRLHAEPCPTPLRPRYITVTVPDLDEAAEAVEAAGFEVVPFTRMPGFMVVVDSLLFVDVVEEEVAP